MAGLSTGAVVLCAGKGARMGELSQHTPKPLMWVNGRPLLDYALANLARCGVRAVGLNLLTHSDKVRAFTGDGARWNLKLELVEEPELTGTAGGVRALSGVVRAHSETLVIYGDILTNQHFAPLLAAHRRFGALATLITHRSKSSNSVVELAADGRVERFIERPSPEERALHGEAWTNSGLFVISPRVLDFIPKTGFADFPIHVFPELIARRGLYAVPLTGYRVAIDTPDRLQLAEAESRHHAFP